ncbi:MerR family transcriptional regulator [Devosia lacusdianchii]|uniref:MerR family transcriptional regulator n=1 Tax=Devosia lacusdianchii TaxID=2917991 RepID=UPI001F0645DF|nr:MerR family transcriptional regulator [Devosia sp. JXJ CY 41]
MKTYTVNKLAQLAGISVRALHHYDEIGLLKPAFTGDNRYRYYGDEELLRLQQILIHRELDIPLAEIGAILDAPGFDKIETLQRQRERLDENAKRYARMVKTIDRTIARLKGDRAMKDADLYSGIVSPEKQAEYERWLIDRYGAPMERDIAHSRKRMDKMSKAEIDAAMQELRAVEEGLAEGLRRGVPPQSTSLDPMIERHKDWVGGAWDRECTPEAYAGLADVYEHPDFRKRYEAIEPGFADYLMTAMRSWSKRQAQ